MTAGPATATAIIPSSAATRRVIAVNRFGLGARPGELSAPGDDPRGWLMAQVSGPAPLPQPLIGLPSSADIFTRFQSYVSDLRAARMGAADGPDGAQKARALMGSLGKTFGPYYRQQVLARMQVAVTTSQPFRERLVQFWTNHFAISADKAATIGQGGPLENEAIRPHVSGHFADMLLAVQKHPAMLAYLDNLRSIGPHSRLAELAARRRRNPNLKLGINENLARETLELHTMGAEGGYSQKDVTTLSEVITGWTVGGGRGPFRRGEPGQFTFVEAMHEPGPKVILGKRYEDDGLGQGEAVLRDLAAHPATAHYLATKLARHFIADTPPAEAVAAIAKAYRDHGGYLPAVYRALVDQSSAWAEPAVKYKTPNDLVISTFRAIGFVPEKPQQAIAPLIALGQPAYRPGSPAGWPDTAADWGGADALLNRIDFAAAVGARVGGRTNPMEVLGSALGDAADDHTRTTVSRAASAAQGLALLFASPDFQRR